MSTKKSRKRFSLDLKYEVIKLIDNKTRFPEIIYQLKDNEITIKNIYKFKSQRSEIIKCFENSISSQVKSLRKCFYPKLEEELLQFVSISAANGLPINTVVLKENANEFASA